MLRSALERAKAEAPPLEELFHSFHYESLMLDGFEDDNVRGLIDLADRITTRMRAGGEPGEVVNESVSENEFLKRPIQAKKTYKAFLLGLF